jgi:hypothetical protein
MDKPSKFVLCLRNDHCEDLERGKVYQLIADAGATKNGYLRVVDETGEDLPLSRKLLQSGETSAQSARSPGSRPLEFL